MVTGRFLFCPQGECDTVEYRQLSGSHGFMQGRYSEYLGIAVSSVTEFLAHVPTGFQNCK
jgi:hypothetical protein